MMEVLEILKDIVLPELKEIRQEQAHMRELLGVTNRRLDDLTSHLVDQSRRIDAVRSELSDRIDTVREELGTRIDTVREELGTRIDAVREELGARIDAVREELGARIDDTHKRLDDTNRRLDVTNQRLDTVHSELTGRIMTVHSDLTSRLESGHADFISRSDALKSSLSIELMENHRLIIETNKRLDRLYEVIVRREDHQKLEQRLHQLEQEVVAIKSRLAA